MTSMGVFGPPRHRAIFAVDIECSTTRTNPARGELRAAMYELVEESLRANGITADHRDPSVDRGDGILILVRPADDVPKTLLLSGVVPMLTDLLAEHERGHPGRRLRLRAVVHAGEVHQDQQGPYGEALDVAFRLLDAPEVKRRFRLTTSPLLLVVSDLIYGSIVRHGYDGIDRSRFAPLPDVVVGGARHPGWVWLPEPQHVPDRSDPESTTGARVLRAARRFEERKHVV